MEKLIPTKVYAASKVQKPEAEAVGLRGLGKPSKDASTGITFSLTDVKKKEHDSKQLGL